MTNLPARRSIQEFGLNDSEELKLYLELIRIIEKDIDEIKAAATKNGWTSWAMVGSILGALLLFLGETRKLHTFPTEQVKTIWLAGLLLYTVAISSLRVLYVDDQNIRPGRIRWSNAVYFSHVPSGIFTFLIFLIALITAWTSSLPILTRIATLSAFAVWTIWMALLLVLSKREFPLGNTRILTRGGRWVSWVNFFLSLLSLVLVTIHLQRPLGEDATVPFLLGGLLVAITLLTIRLIFTMAPSRLLSDLKDLLNDIIFLRADLDEGLRRYEVISEGETLPDALQKELSDVLGDVNVLAYAHPNMDSLIKKMLEQLPFPDDMPEKKEHKAKQMALDKDSYFLHESKCDEIFGSLETKLKGLDKKMQTVASATGDWAGANTIRASLARQLEWVQRSKTELKRRRQAIDYYSNHPNEIPKDLQSAQEPSNN